MLLGVGKSSLVNTLIPDASARVGSLTMGDVGAHTTSNARLYYTKHGGRIIDSPGIREFGMWHLESKTIAEGFVEVAAAASRCKFRNCAHDARSQGCAVLKAIDDGEILPSRYRNFLSLRDGEI